MISTEWTKGMMDEREEAQFIEYLKNQSNLLDRILDILTNREKTIGKSILTPNSFDNPNWALKVAYNNGRLSVLDELKELITSAKG